MSSLVKNFHMNIDLEAPKKVIDNNTLSEQKLAAMREKMAAMSTDGFTAGLFPNSYEGDVILGEDGLPLEGDFTEGAYAEDGFTEGLVFGEAPTSDGTGNVIKATSVDAAAYLEQVKEQAEAILADAQAQANRIVDDALIEADAQSQTIKENAREQGYQDGYAQAQAQFDAMRQDLENQQAQMASYYEQQLADMEPQLVDTISEIFEHIFHVDMTSHREIVLRLAFDAMQHIDSNRNFLVHVSKEDAPFVLQNKQLLVDAATLPDSVVEIIEDITLGSGDCVIETDSGIVDCGLGTQLSELIQKLRLLSFEKR